MADFRKLGGTGAVSLSMERLGVGQTSRVALWGGGPRGEALDVVLTDTSKARISEIPASFGADLRGFELLGVQPGDAVLEARTSAGAVWASLPLNITERPVSGTAISALSPAEKLGEAIRRSIPKLPADVRAQVEGLLTPQALRIMAGITAAWGVSHFFGVGEVADVVLMLVGAAFIGTAAAEVGDDLLTGFVRGSLEAQSEADLDAAAARFAHAIAMIGVTTVVAVLLHRTAGKTRTRLQSSVAPESRGLISRASLNINLLKRLAIQSWEKGGLNSVVKVVRRSRGPLQEVRGYVTQEKFIRGRNLTEIEKILGLPEGELKEGANFMRLERLPAAGEFELRGYTNTPAGEVYTGGGYPPGYGAPQWELTADIPAVPLKEVGRGGVF